MHTSNTDDDLTTSGHDDPGFLVNPLHMWLVPALPGRSPGRVVCVVLPPSGAETLSWATTIEASLNTPDTALSPRRTTDAGLVSGECLAVVVGEMFVENSRAAAEDFPDWTHAAFSSDERCVKVLHEVYLPSDVAWLPLVAMLDDGELYAGCDGSKAGPAAGVVAQCGQQASICPAGSSGSSEYASSRLDWLDLNGVDWLDLEGARHVVARAGVKCGTVPAGRGGGPVHRQRAGPATNTGRYVQTAVAFAVLCFLYSIWLHLL